MCTYDSMVAEYNEIVLEAFPTEESFFNDTPVLTSLQEERIRWLNSELIAAELNGEVPDGYFMKNVLEYITF